MKITVLGTGDMGAALAKALKRTRHQVLLRGSAEGSGSCKALSESLGLPEAKIADIADSNIVFLVVPDAGLKSAAAQLEGFDGIIVSVVGVSGYLIDENKSKQSAAETVAKLVPGASVVHGYTWMSSGSVELSSERANTSVVHCSDDRDALNTVCHLSDEMGFKPVKAGKLINSRFAEAAGFLWGAIAIEEDYGWNTYFEVHPENSTTE